MSKPAEPLPALTSCSIEKLTPDSDYDLGHFDCGEPAYNDYLHHRAKEAVQAGSAAVYLLIDRGGDDPRVVGYWAMCPHSVAREEASRKWTKGHYNPVAAWLIGQFALHSDLRGRVVPGYDFTYGRLLMRAALSRIVALADRGAGALIVLDADNEYLMSYYERYDFEPAKRDSAGRPLGFRMVMKIATARDALHSTSASLTAGRE